MQLNRSDFKLIAKHLIRLPILKQPILILISKLYEQIAQLSDFSELLIIFLNNFPISSNRTDIEALLRISVEETLSMMVKKIEERSQLTEIVLEIAQKEAKNKLETMPLIMTSKTKAILNFIIQVVKFGRPIWHEII